MAWVGYAVGGRLLERSLDVGGSDINSGRRVLIGLRLCRKRT